MGDFNPNVTVMAPLHVDDSGWEWDLRSTSAWYVPNASWILRSTKLLVLF